MHQSGYIKQGEPYKVTLFENVDIKSNKWEEHILAVAGSHNVRVGDVTADGYPDIIGSNWNHSLTNRWLLRSGRILSLSILKKILSLRY